MSSHTETETAVELALLRTELHTTNATMGRIATAMEKTLGDHETRIRALEVAKQSTSGALKLISFVGAAPVAGLIYLLANHAK